MTLQENNTYTFDETKHNKIQDMLDANDIDRLRDIVCSPEGMLDLNLRERAWPLFINSDPCLVSSLKINTSNSETEDAGKWDDIDRQVKKDVDRSFIYLDDSTHDIKALKIRLQKLIMKVLRALPDLNYYQGYHDVASVVVLTFSNDNDAFQFLYTLSLQYLRDHMMTTIDPTMQQLDLIIEILSYADTELYHILKSLTPVYALSSIITMFAHDVTDFNDISLIWDFIFANNNPQYVLYVYVALVLYYKDDILADLTEMSDSSLSTKGTDFGFDDDIIHLVMNNFIKTHLTTTSLDSKLEVNHILQLATEIKNIYPLTKFKTFKSISKYSFLKSNSISKTILHLQVGEHKIKEKKLNYQSKIIKKLSDRKKIKRKFSNTPLIYKISLGFVIVGIVLHTKKPSSIFSFIDRMLK